MGRVINNVRVPLKNCFNCELYDKCGQYDDDRCLLKMKRKNKRITVQWNGKRMSIPQWATVLGVSYTTLWYKIKVQGIDKVLKDVLEAADAERTV